MSIKHLLIAAALSFSSTAVAGPIENGIRSGQLTRGEVSVLQQDQAALAHARRAAMADGRITARERARINALQRKLHRDTRALTHNRARR